MWAPNSSKAKKRKTISKIHFLSWVIFTFRKTFRFHFPWQMAHTLHNRMDIECERNEMKRSIQQHKSSVPNCKTMSIYYSIFYTHTRILRKRIEMRWHQTNDILSKDEYRTKCFEQWWNFRKMQKGHFWHASELLLILQNKRRIWTQQDLVFGFIWSFSIL